MSRVQCPENRRLTHDPWDAEHADRDEPDDHHRAEEAAHAVRAELLNDEDAQDDGHRDRQHVRREERGSDLKPLDRAEHGDGWCDHAVAVEQRRTEDAESDEERTIQRRPTVTRIPPGLWKECQEGENAALTLVVGSHDDRDVLDRDDDDQRVQDERQHAEDVVVRRRHGMRAEETLANRVEGARPDVAVDDTNRGEREREQRAALVGLAGCRHPSREDSTLDCRRRRDINGPVVRTPSTLPFSQASTCQNSNHKRLFARGYLQPIACARTLTTLT